MPPAATLVDRVRLLLHRAGTLYPEGPPRAILGTAAARLDEPLRVALAGRVKAGKSTLLNAMVGQELAATDAGECTRMVTWFRDGHAYRVVVHPRGGPPRPLPPGPSGGLFDLDLQGLQAEDVERLVVDWPSLALRTMTLIDTPGLGSLSRELSSRTEAALTGRADGPAEVDAVVYLMRHVHASDVRFLESFRDDPSDRRPINTVGVLARADEVGHCRIDALDSAGRVAERYRRDPRVRALCQTVLPVAGLLASTAATLREEEFRALALLSGAPEAEIERLLLSADRFTGAETDLALSGEVRARLLDRFGLYGLRLSVRLIHDGISTTSRELVRELAVRSGLEPLREALLNRFASRADVLKARSALLAVEQVLQRYPHGSSDALRRELEQITDGAHEFAELRLLDALRSGGAMLTDDERGEAERLLGDVGVSWTARLGLPDEAPAPDGLAAAQAALARWQRRGEHPASTRETRQASRVLVRTCEGLILALGTGRPGGPGGAAPGSRPTTGVAR